MVLALMVTMVLSTLSLAVVTSSRASVEGARNLLGRGESKAMAVNAFEDFYARMETVPGFAESVLADAGGLATARLDLTTVHPGYTPFAQRTTNPRWATFDGASVVPCPADLQTDCFSITATAASQSAIGQVTSILLDVTSLSRCGGIVNRCVTTHHQQRLRQAQFFDYLYFNQYSTLDPQIYPGGPNAACADRYASARAGRGCTDMAFNDYDSTGTDQIDGPVYTADERVLLCGNPNFTYNPSGSSTRKKDITSTGGTAWQTFAAFSPSSTCPPTTVAPSTATRAAVLTMPSSTTTVADARDVVKDNRYVISGDATVNLATTGSGPAASTSIQVTSAAGTTTLPLPEPAVLVVTGTATVHGKLAGKLSIFAGTDIVIDQDLTYEGGASNSNTRDVLALSAGRSIKITQYIPPFPTVPAYTDRIVHGVLVALNGSVYVENWDDSQYPDSGYGINPGAPVGTPDTRWIDRLAAQGRAPVLTFFGAMASKYQGVFGGFDTETGEVQSGYVKNFTFDSRLANGDTTPPYVIAPTAKSWERLPVTDAAADMAEVVIGQTAGGTYIAPRDTTGIQTGTTTGTTTTTTGSTGTTTTTNTSPTQTYPAPTCSPTPNIAC